METVRVPDTTFGPLVYRLDEATHRVIVSNREGQTLFAFGGYGSRPGQLNTPLDLVLVSPEFHGERLPESTLDALWIAVADYGNRRVQGFDLDGCVVGVVGVSRATAGGPCRLTWRSPVLDVEHPDGFRSVMHLAGALLHVTQPLPPSPSGLAAVCSGITH